jgi:hypothetical protein
MGYVAPASLFTPSGEFSRLVAGPLLLSTLLSPVDKVSPRAAYVGDQTRSGAAETDLGNFSRLLRLNVDQAAVSFFLGVGQTTTQERDSAVAATMLVKVRDFVQKLAYLAVLHADAPQTGKRVVKREDIILDENYTRDRIWHLTETKEFSEFADHVRTDQLSFEKDQDIRLLIKNRFSNWTNRTVADVLGIETKTGINVARVVLNEDPNTGPMLMSEKEDGSFIFNTTTRDGPFWLGHLALILAGGICDCYRCQREPMRLLERFSSLEDARSDIFRPRDPLHCDEVLYTAVVPSVVDRVARIFGFCRDAEGAILKGLQAWETGWGKHPSPRWQMWFAFAGEQGNQDIWGKSIAEFRKEANSFFTPDRRNVFKHPSAKAVRPMGNGEPKPPTRSRPARQLFRDKIIFRADQDVKVALSLNQNRIILAQPEARVPGDAEEWLFRQLRVEVKFDAQIPESQITPAKGGRYTTYNGVTFEIDSEQWEHNTYSFRIRTIDENIPLPAGPLFRDSDPPEFFVIAENLQSVLTVRILANTVDMRLKNAPATLSAGEAVERARAFVSARNIPQPAGQQHEFLVEEWHLIEVQNVDDG